MKFLFIGFLVFVAFKLFTGNRLPQGNKKESIESDDDYSDYEEIV